MQARPQVPTTATSVKRLRIIFFASAAFLLASTAVFLLIQHRNREDDCRKENDIKIIDEELNQAFIKLDFNILQCRLDDGWTGVGVSGQSFRKKTMLADLKKSVEQNGVEIKYSMTVTEREVSIHDNVAVVNARAIMDYGKEKVMVAYTRVYNFNDFWHCVSEQLTKVK